MNGRFANRNAPCLCQLKFTVFGSFLKVGKKAAIYQRDTIFGKSISDIFIRNIKIIVCLHSK